MNRQQTGLRPYMKNSMDDMRTAKHQSEHFTPPVAFMAPSGMPPEAPLYRENEKRVVGETYRIQEIDQALLRNILLAVMLFYNIFTCAQIPVRTIHKEGAVVLSVRGCGAGVRFTLSAGENKNAGSPSGIAPVVESDAPGMFRFLSGLRDFIGLKEDRPMTVRLNDSVRIEKPGFQTGLIQIYEDGVAGYVQLSHNELDKLYKEFIAWRQKNDIDYNRNTPV